VRQAAEVGDDIFDIFREFHERLKKKSKLANFEIIGTIADIHQQVLSIIFQFFPCMGVGVVKTKQKTVWRGV
jgi:hypothetical protein